MKLKSEFVKRYNAHIAYHRVYMVTTTLQSWRVKKAGAAWILYCLRSLFSWRPFFRPAPDLGSLSWLRRFSLLFQPNEAIQINLILSLVISVALIARIRKDIDYGILKRLVIGSAAGLPLGIVIFPLSIFVI